VFPSIFHTDTVSYSEDGWLCDLSSTLPSGHVVVILFAGNTRSGPHRDIASFFEVVEKEEEEEEEEEEEDEEEKEEEESEERQLLETMAKCEGFETETVSVLRPQRRSNL